MTCAIHVPSHTEKLEVFYVPRTANFEAVLSVGELTDLNNSMISYYCTVDQDVITGFEDVSHVSSFKVQDFNSISPYMYIRYKGKDDKELNIIVNDNIFLQIDGIVYRMSKEFKEWINDGLPIATLPKGSRVSNCR